MGLHHLPQDQLNIYLQMIYRILRPNGLFLFREHHAYEELKPLLDVAHMVFNVVTGVDYESEVNEIRAFRTIEQWRSCLRQAGFEDTFIYDEQEDDPTDDIMIVVRKPETQNLNTDEQIEHFQQIKASPESNYFRPCEWIVVRIAIQFGQYLNHTPFFFFPYMKYLFIYWSLFRTETELAIGKFGLKTAVISSAGFLMNGVVGILLSIAFIQLSFFSFLVRFIGGVRTKPEYEQLVLENIENNFDFKQSIDEQIDDIQKLRKEGRYAIRVPRHRGFTSILKKLALYQTKFNLLSISNQNEKIQIELTINHNDEKCLLWLKQRSNLEIIFEYKNPTDQTQTIIFIGVDIKHLFSFIRDCTPFEEQNSLSIVQIFDYYD
jgi:SAM-dependent methyltransferase